MPGQIRPKDIIGDGPNKVIATDGAGIVGWRDAATVGPQGDPGPTGQGFTMRGPWSSGTPYSPYDVVTYAGETFECHSYVTSATAPSADAAHWYLWSARGQGPQGDPGPKGDKGDKGDPGTDGADGVQGPQGIQGIQGVKGDKGDPGNDGANGANGVNGSIWRSGAGVPNNALGANGDFYLDSTSSDVYVKAAGAYLFVMNIQGASGALGVVFGEVPSGVVDGVNDTFTVTHAPISGALTVRVRLTEGQYTVTGDTIVITDPNSIPQPNDPFLYDYQF